MEPPLTEPGVPVGSLAKTLLLSTVEHMGTPRRALSLALVAAFVLSAGTLLSVRTSTPSLASYDAAVDACGRSGQDPVNCLTAERKQFSDRGVTKTTQVARLLARYERNDKMPVICHVALHAIGQTIDPERESISVYRDYLESCSRGLVHGLSDTHRFPTETGEAAQELVRFCRAIEQAFDQQIASAPSLIDDACWHPVGHTLFHQFESSAKAVTICIEGSPVGRHRYECTQAAMMNDPQVLETIGFDPSAPAKALDAYEQACRALSQSDKDAFHGCWTVIARKVMQTKSPLIPAFTARCTALGEPLASGCTFFGAEYVALAYTEEDMPLEKAARLFCVDEQRLVMCMANVTQRLVNNGFHSPEQAFVEAKTAMERIQPDSLPAFVEAVREFLPQLRTE